MLRRNTEARSWFRKKRWWIVLMVAGIAMYQNFSNGGQARVDGYKQTSVYVRVVRFFGP